MRSHRVISERYFSTTVIHCFLSSELLLSSLLFRFEASLLLPLCPLSSRFLLLPQRYLSFFFCLLIEFLLRQSSSSFRLDRENISSPESVLFSSSSSPFFRRVSLIRDRYFFLFCYFVLSWLLFSAATPAADFRRYASPLSPRWDISMRDEHGRNSFIAARFQIDFRVICFLFRFRYMVIFFMLRYISLRFLSTIYQFRRFIQILIFQAFSEASARRQIYASVILRRLSMPYFLY